MTLAEYIACAVEKNLPCHDPSVLTVPQVTRVGNEPDNISVVQESTHARARPHTRKNKPCMIMGEDFKVQTSLNMLHPPVFRILLCKSEPYKVDMNLI